MSDVLRVPRLTREQFADRFLRCGPPVVITEDLPAWTGTTRWTFDELRARWGNRTVPAWVTPEGEWSYASDRQTVLFSALIDAALTTGSGSRRISGPQLNLRRDIPWAAVDIDVPPFVRRDAIVSMNLWLQAAGDKTHLHWDEDPGVLGLIHGEKEIALYAPSDWRSLYPTGSGPGANWSRVDFWRPNASVFPRFGDARPLLVTLRAGEMLFVPPTWWHCVHTTQPSISVNCWWSEPAAEVGETYRRFQQFGAMVERIEENRENTENTEDTGPER